MLSKGEQLLNKVQYAFEPLNLLLAGGGGASQPMKLQIRQIEQTRKKTDES